MNRLASFGTDESPATRRIGFVRVRLPAELGFVRLSQFRRFLRSNRSRVGRLENEAISQRLPPFETPLTPLCHRKLLEIMGLRPVNGYPRVPVGDVLDRDSAPVNPRLTAARSGRASDSHSVGDRLPARRSHRIPLIDLCCFHTFILPETPSLVPSNQSTVARLSRPRWRMERVDSAGPSVDSPKAILPPSESRTLVKENQSINFRARLPSRDDTRSGSGDSPREHS